MFPVFHLMPPGVAAQQQEPREDLDKIPARVRVALHYLAMCTGKTSVTVVPRPGDVFDTVDGQELVGHEREAQRAACVLLGAFFAGTLVPSAAEMANLIMGQEGPTPVPMRDGKCVFCGATSFIGGVDVCGKTDHPRCSS